MAEHIETVIIGGGQAGLSTGFALQRRDRPFVILEARARIGDQWRGLYDSLALYSPAKYDGLPGMDFPGDPWSFPRGDEVADYLEDYAVTKALPVRTNTPVRRVGRTDEGFVVELDGGATTCDNVVVASGRFGPPAVPAEADDLRGDIVQLHSSSYRRPDLLPPGRVLVVGAGHSGTDIAHELAATHAVTLCGRVHGQLPFRPEQRRARVMMPLMVFAWRHVLTRRTPIGRRMMPDVRHGGGPMIRVHRDDLDARGVVRTASRLVGTRDGLPLLDDGTVVDVSSVIWATGYHLDLSWLDIPVVGDDGYPREYRGVAEDVPGLFFCGLPFQFGFGSMVFAGVGRDAEYVARRVAERSAARTQPVA
ncbi:NAD(P)/FAD-dependent oxidoreductase [Microbacterium sp. Mu-80]|uniref:NAD(P)/FAD-dependent oxidoreductase n=1 Tax=Microbacterium bandirmense TaxID=3122050 RepID=A0ABU8LEQ4_9MICO